MMVTSQQHRCLEVCSKAHDGVRQVNLALYAQQHNIGKVEW